jgi:hypothetical protein
VHLECEERNYDPDPTDTLVTSDFVLRVRQLDHAPESYHDRHFFGLFGRDTWLNLSRAAGFVTRIHAHPHHREFIVGTAA